MPQAPGAGGPSRPFPAVAAAADLLHRLLGSLTWVGITRIGRWALAALRTESDRQLEDLIRRPLALPVEKRMNFLRRRLPGGGSCL